MEFWPRCEVDAEDGGLTHLVLKYITISIKIIQYSIIILVVVLVHLVVRAVVLQHSTHSFLPRVELHYFVAFAELVEDELELVGEVGQLLAAWQGRGWEQRVQTYPKRVLDHARDQLRQQGRRQLQARVRIDLNQVRIPVPIYHKVHSKYLEAVLPCPTIRIHKPSLHHISRHPLHPLQNLPKLIHPTPILPIHIPLELLIRHLIPLLILTIVLAILLHCIIREVNQPVEVQEVELGGGCSNVPLLVPVPFDEPVDGGDHKVVPDVELPVFVEEGLAHVELDDVGFGFAVEVLLLALDYALDLVEIVADCYPVTSVREFSRLDDPYILFPVALALVVESGQGGVFGILQPRDDVEGQGEVLSVVLVQQAVVLPHGVKQGFLVPDHSTVLDVVGDLTDFESIEPFQEPFSAFECFLCFSFLFEVQLHVVAVSPVLISIHELKGWIILHYDLKAFFPPSWLRGSCEYHFAILCGD